MGQTGRSPMVRHHTLPPVPDALAEHVVGRDIETLGDPSLAFALVLTLRDVRNWAEPCLDAQPGRLKLRSRDRTEALARAAAVVPEIAPALETVSLLRTSPAGVDPAALGSACRRLARWADKRGLPEFAVRFAEAAARLNPEDPALANDAARAARRAGLYEHADIWYDRGIALAGRQNNRREVIRGLLGHGSLLREQGQYDGARALMERAANLARSTRRHRLAAEAQHDLLTLAVEVGTFREAEAHMISALEHYPIHHVAVPRLVHDWSFLLVLNALYEEAKGLLETVIPQIRQIEIELLSWGTLSRAAAGSGHRAQFDQAVEHILRLSEPRGEFAAAALANAAFGARFFAEWDLGQTLATRAIEIARVRREESVERGAREFLIAIEAREPPPTQAVPPEGSRIEIISSRIMQLLEARKRPPRRPIQDDPEARGR